MDSRTCCVDDVGDVFCSRVLITFLFRETVVSS